MSKSDDIIYSMGRYLVLIAIMALIFACQPEKSKKNKNNAEVQPGYTSYSEDVSFMEEYIDLIQLSDPAGNAKVALSAELQGRVMTSTSSGSNGRSYGWINRAHFESGDTLDHINVFGGDERLWIGPEGGQFSIFFKNGSDFTLENWYTPRLIDLEPFEVKIRTTDKAVFTKKASLVNYSGFKFDLGIEREVSVLSKQEAFNELGIEQIEGIDLVAYKTTNSMTNLGNADWLKETGLLSIWLLGMYPPSSETTVIIPFVKGNEEELGKRVNDEYFGKVPEDRLVLTKELIYFNGDGKYRSKIGLTPSRAKDILGSYDALSKTLTIIKYNKPADSSAYVNSMWEIQEDPFSGDVINSYNDGPPEPGKEPMGPFYELETSSPALELKIGETGTHIQLTCHIHGDPALLTKITEKLFGVPISKINGVFRKK